MFKKAVRENIKIKIAVMGPSGSGKTYSSLLLARGLGEKIALIDTENNSANLYSDLLDFDICKISEPYTSKKFIDAINFAVKEGYDTIIIDSISHEWSGSGGILDRKTIKDSIGGSSYSNWRDFTAEHNAFVSCILNSNANIICTMRSKTEYILEENEKGKMAPKKMGMAPIQRDNVDYEFSIVFDVKQNHFSTIAKDRTGIFPSESCFVVDENIGKTIKSFINSGSDVFYPSIVANKTLKENILDCVNMISDLALRKRIVETVTNENDEEKLKKFDIRVNEILNNENKSV